MKPEWEVAIRNQSKLKKYAYKKCGCKDYSSDLYQRAFIILCESYKEFNGTASVISFMTLTINKLIATDRRGKKIKENIDHGGCDDDLRNEIADLLLKLNKYERIIFYEYYTSSITCRDLSIKTGIKEKTIRQILWRSKKIIREKVSNQEKSRIIQIAMKRGAKAPYKD